MILIRNETLLYTHEYHHEVMHAFTHRYTPVILAHLSNSSILNQANSYLLTSFFAQLGESSLPEKSGQRSPLPKLRPHVRSKVTVEEFRSRVNSRRHYALKVKGYFQNVLKASIQ